MEYRKTSLDAYAIGLSQKQQEKIAKGTLATGTEAANDRKEAIIHDKFDKLG